MGTGWWSLHTRLLYSLNACVRSRGDVSTTANQVKTPKGGQDLRGWEKAIVDLWGNVEMPPMSSSNRAVRVCCCWRVCLRERVRVGTKKRRSPKAKSTESLHRSVQRSYLIRKKALCWPNLHIIVCPLDFTPTPTHKDFSITSLGYTAEVLKPEAQATGISCHIRLLTQFLLVCVCAWSSTGLRRFSFIVLRCIRWRGSSFLRTVDALTMRRKHTKSCSPSWTLTRMEKWMCPSWRQAWMLWASRLRKGQLR